MQYYFFVVAKVEEPSSFLLSKMTTKLWKISLIHVSVICGFVRPIYKA